MRSLERLRFIVWGQGYDGGRGHAEGCGHVEGQGHDKEMNIDCKHT